MSHLHSLRRGAVRMGVDLMCGCDILAVMPKAIAPLWVIGT